MKILTQEKNFHITVFCHICEESFQSSDRPILYKLTLSWYITSTLQRQICRQSHDILVFHNWSGSYCQFYIKILVTDIKENISRLALIKEKYFFFTEYVENTSIQEV